MSGWVCVTDYKVTWDIMDRPDSQILSNRDPAIDSYLLSAQNINEIFVLLLVCWNWARDLILRCPNYGACLPENHVLGRCPNLKMEIIEGLRNPGEGRARWSESHYLIRHSTVSWKDFPEKQGINWLISVYSFSALKFPIGQMHLLNPHSFLLWFKDFSNKH